LIFFAGGAFKPFFLFFALGIMPYINASIIMQLLTAVVPTLEQWAKEGEEGRTKITKVTRYSTVFLALIQAFGISVWLQNMGVLMISGFGFRLLLLITLTAGTCFLMWLGEKLLIWYWQWNFYNYFVWNYCQNSFTAGANF